MNKMSTEQAKKRMAEAYSRKAAEFGTVRNERFDAFLVQEMDHFVKSVRVIGTRVVDLGSGPGNESVYFKKAGLKPVCVDFAPGMVEECQKKGLEAYLMDFYRLGFPDESFAGAWMSFALLHVPKREALKVIQEVHRVLCENGVFYVSLFEGEWEGFRDEDEKHFGCARYFAYYQQEELEALLKPYFNVVKSSRLDISPRPTISFECRKREING